MVLDRDLDIPFVMQDLGYILEDVFSMVILDRYYLRVYFVVVYVIQGILKIFILGDLEKVFQEDVGSGSSWIEYFGGYLFCKIFDRQFEMLFIYQNKDVMGMFVTGNLE